MTTQQIACPACKRVLNLPVDALNRIVQCPACKQSFHPAEADPASIRSSLPKPSPQPQPAAADSKRDAPLPRSRPASHSSWESSSRTSRRRKRDTEDLCPKCSAFVPLGANQCPECKAEFDPEEEFKPWEEAGLERRDSEPHRGTLLLFLGIGSIVAPMLFCIPILGLITNLLGLGLGISTWVLSNRDIRKMDNHEMDRGGRGITQGSQVCAIIGLLLSIIGTLVAGFVTISMLLD
jgi:hypothetical protein